MMPTLLMDMDAWVSSVLGPAAHLSLSMMVFRRWAMVRTVQSWNTDRMAVWMRASVSGSTEAVASSSMRMRLWRSIARAMQNSCGRATAGVRSVGVSCLHATSSSCLLGQAVPDTWEPKTHVDIYFYKLTCFWPCEKLLPVNGLQCIVSDGRVASAPHGT